MRALYLTGAVLLTLVWLLARSFAPAGGLTRSYYYPLPRDANPRALETRMLPVVEEPAAGVDLAFLEELHRPVRDYFVRWRGVWFSPRQERIDFRAGADDGVIVRIDGEVVLERHPAVGMHTEMRSVALEAGAHALQIDHWQRGAARRLNVRCFRHQLLLPRPYLVLTKLLRLDIQCQRGASVKIGWKYLDD